MGNGQAIHDIFKFENTQLESVLSDMQNIVKTKGAKKINGIMVDLFTASIITKAYDKVNDANKKKMEKANVQTLVALAHKVMGLKASNEFGKDPLKGFPYNEVKESRDLFLKRQKNNNSKIVFLDIPLLFEKKN